MAVELKLDIDADDVIYSLDSLPKELRYVRKKMLRKLGQKGRTIYRRGVTKETKKRTGSLRKSVKYYLSKRGDKLTIAPSGSRNFIKAYVLQEGRTISAKNGKYLTFKTKKGNWIKTKQINIPARGWFAALLDNYISTGGAQDVLEDVFYKEVQRVWNKRK
jgi:hypothetical protein